MCGVELSLKIISCGMLVLIIWIIGSHYVEYFLILSFGRQAVVRRRLVSCIFLNNLLTMK